MKTNNQYEILTPTGFKPFDGVNRVKKRVIVIETTSGRIRTSLNHQFVYKNRTFTASQIKPGQVIFPNVKVISITLGDEDYLYDPVNVGEGHIYFAGGLLHHNCTFEGSSYTLIDGTKIAALPFLNPEFTKDELEVFYPPNEQSSYVITVDVSRGRHMDYSAFSVFDVSQMPYKVVATFKDNTISTLEYPHLIYNTARQYNNAFILVEINDLGEEVSNTIWHEYEYENVYFTSGSELTQARGYPGVRTTAKVKSLGCSVLKDLVEKDQLFVNSHRIIQELGLFVLHKGSYASEDNTVNDDLCTTLWLFAWLTKQDVFQQFTNIHLRTVLTEKKQQYINDTMTPFGFFQNNKPDDVSDEAVDNRKLPSKDNPYQLTTDQIELLNF